MTIQNSDLESPPIPSSLFRFFDIITASLAAQDRVDFHLCKMVCIAVFHMLFGVCYLAYAMCMCYRGRAVSQRRRS